MQPKRTHTMRDVSTLRQLYDSGQLIFETEFQRDSVWPEAAKAYLIDTILTDRPIPYLYFRRSISAQSGRSNYQVIDGQQRLRAMFEFIDGEFSLKESKGKSLRGKYFGELSESQRTALLAYDIYIEELTGYSDADIREMFVRMNRFVVKLSQQEIRNAKFKGRFKDFTETLGELPFWKTHKVFTPLQLRRLRAVEFAGEAVILLLEGPQDKKAALDLYYGQYERSLPFEKTIGKRLRGYLSWIEQTIPSLRSSRFRRPTDLYALIGALDKISRSGSRLGTLNNQSVGRALAGFERQTRLAEPVGRAAKYVAAASRQTDNLTPRLTRIDVILDVIKQS